MVISYLNKLLNVFLLLLLYCHPQHSLILITVVLKTKSEWTNRKKIPRCLYASAAAATMILRLKRTQLWSNHRLGEMKLYSFVIRELEFSCWTVKTLHGHFFSVLPFHSNEHICRICSISCECSIEIPFCCHLNWIICMLGDGRWHPYF